MEFDSSSDSELETSVIIEEPKKLINLGVQKRQLPVSRPLSLQKTIPVNPKIDKPEKENFDRRKSAKRVEIEDRLQKLRMQRQVLPKANK